MDEVDVPEYAVQHEGQRECHRMVVGEVVGGEGVEGVADDCGRGDDSNHLVEHSDSVGAKDAALVSGGVSGAGEFAPTLGERDEQGAESGADVEPGGYGHFDDDRAREHAQYEAGGDGEYIEKGDVLEVGGVGSLHQDVDDDDDAKLWFEGEGGGQPDERQD